MRELTRSVPGLAPFTPGLVRPTSEFEEAENLGEVGYPRVLPALVSLGHALGTTWSDWSSLATVSLGVVS